MFGYIVPDKPELKIKEFDLFRAYYCGVCKAMGSSFGPLSRFALNYDLVFLGLFWASLNNKAPKLRREACIANPLKKKWIVKENEFLNFAADLNVMLTYYKLKDNWQDEHDPRSLAAQAVFYNGYKKAQSKNPDLDKRIAESIHQLTLLEKQKCSSMDAAAEPFANLMKQLLRAGYHGNDNAVARPVEWIGYNLGKWIYLIDAYDDIEKDAGSGSYNPLIYQYGYTNGENIQMFKNKIREEVSFNLTHSLGQIAGAVELLNVGNKPIIDNILYLGLQKKTENILFKCKGKERTEHEKSI